jgi:hypothetical protein
MTLPQRSGTRPDGLVDDGTYRLASGDLPPRDGRNPLERLALHRANLDLAALPAPVVVQLAVWPNMVASLARESGRSPAMFYNALSRGNGRPYHPVRQLFVDYLRQLAEADEPALVETITKLAVDHLIDARPAQHHGDRPIAAPGRRDEPLVPPAHAGWDPAAPPPVRDGGNPIERMALAALHRNIAAMPASEVAQLVLWPSSLAGWAKAAGLEQGAVYNAFAWRNGWAYAKIRAGFAELCGVSVFAVDALIEAPRPPAPAVTPMRPSAGTAAQGTLLPPPG